MDDPNAYVLKFYLDKLDRKLEDYTLKEVKQLCGNQLDCPDCLFYDVEEDGCKLNSRLPEHWSI